MGRPRKKPIEAKVTIKPLERYEFKCPCRVQIEFSEFDIIKLWPYSWKDEGIFYKNSKKMICLHILEEK